MERFARAVVARPRLVIAVVLLLTAGLVSALRNLRLEVTAQDELPENHPYIQIDQRLNARLGVDRTSLLAIGVRDGDIFTTRSLARLQRLTEAVARLPGVLPATVLSLASPQVKVTYPEPGGFRVAPLLESIPDDPAGLRALRETVFSYPMYVGNLVTADGRGAIILADFADRTPPSAVLDGLEALAASERDDETEIYVGGQCVLAALERTTRSLAPLVLLAVAVIGLVHYEAFRTLQAVFLPLTTAALSVVWAMGLLVVLGFTLTPWTAITAILILSVAAGHAVQILKRYYECWEEFRDNRAAVVAAMTRIGPVMLTAGLVAAAGFASLTTMGVPAVRDFGLMAAFGVLSALAIELTFIPACRVLLRPPRPREAARERGHGLVDPAVDAITAAVCGRPRLVLGAGIAVVLIAALGISRLQVNSSVRSWFPADTPVIAQERMVRARFTGTSTLKILVEGDAPEALLDPAALRGMATLQQTLADDPNISATLSAADFVQVLNRAMHDGAPDAYRIPDSRALIAQELLLYGPSDLGRLLSADYQTGVIYALARSDDVAWIEGLFARLRVVAHQAFPAGIRVSVAGGELGQAAAMNGTVVREKLSNMLQVSIVIVALTSVVFRSMTAGLLVFMPLACAALVNLGLMGWTGSWLSFATASYTAAGVSLGADFAIYLLFRLREEVRHRAMPDAIREALRTSGRAILFVASAIAAGYATLLLSDFALWRQLGVYVALMMATSALATLTLLPSLLLLRTPRFLTPRRSLDRDPTPSDAAAKPLTVTPGGEQRAANPACATSATPAPASCPEAE
jgi:uncharacterized protein